MAETKKEVTNKKLAVKIPKNKVSSGRLKLLVTIVPRNKTEFYEDLIQSLGANMQMIYFAHGTATNEIIAKRSFEYLGSEKSVIFSIIKEELQKKVFETLEDKFKTVKKGKGICFTIPFSSIIGASAYSFLSDNRDIIKKDK